MNSAQAMRLVHNPMLFILSLAILFVSFFAIGQESSLWTPTSILLEIDTKRHEHFRVFWKKRDQDYSQERSARVFLHPDRTSYRIKLPGYGGYDTLRIDPFEQPAAIRLKSLNFQVGSRILLSKNDGDSLHKILVPVEQSCTVVPLGAGITISSAGSDARLEFRIKKPAVFFSAYRLTLPLACLLALVTTAFLFYLISDKYRHYGSTGYPRSTWSWIGWAGWVFIGTAYLLFAIPLTPHPDASILVFPAWFAVISAWIFIPTFYFATREISRSLPPYPSRFAWLGYGAPIFIVFTLYLLAFWPGSMSPDSLDQWGQITTFDFKDWHPAFHSLTLWLVTRIGESPSIAAVFQICLFGGAFGWALARLQANGVPRIILVATSLFFALVPVNGLMAITIWKDIPYSVAMLVLAVCLLEIALSSGIWLASRKNILLLSLAILFVSLYRHNGILPAAAVPPLLFVLYPRQWRGVVIVIITAGCLNFLIRGPLYTHLDVNRKTPLDHVVKELQGKVSQMLDGDEKREDPPAVSGSGVTIQGNQKETVALAGMPEVMKSSSLLWRVKPLEGYYKRVDYVNLWGQQKETLRIRYISGNDFGLTEDPKLPGLTKRLYELFRSSKYHGWLFWMWRPAVFLYLLVSAAMIATVRNRKLLVLPLVPLLLNSLPTLVILIHKSIYRYHYSLVLTAFLLILPYLFVTPERSENPRY